MFGLLAARTWWFESATIVIEQVSLLAFCLSNAGHAMQWGTESPYTLCLRFEKRFFSIHSECLWDLKRDSKLSKLSKDFLPRSSAIEWSWSTLDSCRWSTAVRQRDLLYRGLQKCISGANRAISQGNPTHAKFFCFGKPDALEWEYSQQ